MQAYEYTLCYQMKWAQTVFDIEYILGGIGSMFRRDLLEAIRFYDTNTVTEDIDLTMKILHNGNKNCRVMYGSNVVTYTQHEVSLRDLVRQCYCWKWGRYQTFLKNKDMFFSGGRKFTRGLSWFYLPFALCSDLAFFFEPTLLAFIWSIVIYYRDFASLLTMIAVTSCYLGMSILAEDTYSLQDRARLLALVPLMYFLFYILSLVEYIALLRSWGNLHNLKPSLSADNYSWQPISRPDLWQSDCCGLGRTSAGRHRSFSPPDQHEIDDFVGRACRDPRTSYSSISAEVRLPSRLWNSRSAFFSGPSSDPRPSQEELPRQRAAAAEA